MRVVVLEPRLDRGSDRNYARYSRGRKMHSRTRGWGSQTDCGRKIGPDDWEGIRPAKFVTCGSCQASVAFQTSAAEEANA